MDWIMQPLSGFSNLDDLGLIPQACGDGGGTYTVTCTCQGGLLVCQAGATLS